VRAAAADVRPFLLGGTSRSGDTQIVPIGKAIDRGTHGRLLTGTKVTGLNVDLEIRVLTRDGELLLARTLDYHHEASNPDHNRAERETMSRDITRWAPVGLQPTTRGLEGAMMPQ
jgi:hypothetical protein